MTYTELPLFEFLNELLVTEIADIDQLNYIQCKTDNFSEYPLKLMIRDVKKFSNYSLRIQAYKAIRNSITLEETYNLVDCTVSNYLEYLYQESFRWLYSNNKNNRIGDEDQKKLDAFRLLIKKIIESESITEKLLSVFNIHTKTEDLLSPYALKSVIILPNIWRISDFSDILLSKYSEQLSLKSVGGVQLSANEVSNENVIALSEIFAVNDWETYVDVLTLCTPPLLKKEGTRYIYIGNENTERGCIAQWFRYLKNRGILRRGLNRKNLANILSEVIVDFSIGGASIDNQSETYTKKYEKQLLDLISMS